MEANSTISTIQTTAEQFLDACETGKGWQACQRYCHPNATFSAQADALTGVNTVEAYTEWMRGLFTPIPDGRYEVRSCAVDEARGNAAFVAVFYGSHTGEGGPVPPTGRSIAVEYAYLLEFAGDRIQRMTKVWNDVATMKQLGWMG
jgi:predicted ester cyclase